MTQISMKGITRRGPSYRFTVYLGRDENGKQLRRYKTWRPPEGLPRREQDRLAAAAYAQFRDRFQLRNRAQAHPIRFGELFERYFQEYAPAHLRPSTAYVYKKNGTGYLLPVFGKRIAEEITTPELSAFFTGHPELAGSTCGNIKVIMSSILSYGVQQGYLRENVCRHALCRAAEKYEPTVLDPAQAATLNAALLADFCPESTILHTMLHTGMRTGECLALQWENIDFENQLIRIEHTLSVGEDGPYLSEPKTKSSIRTLHFDACVFDMLRRYQSWQRKQTAREGTLIFTKPDGTYYSRNHLRTYLNVLMRRNQLPHCTLHGLRHTFASLMICEGANLKAVSSVLGHSSVRVTGDVYSHTFAECEAKAVCAVSLKIAEERPGA